MNFEEVSSKNAKQLKDLYTALEYLVGQGSTLKRDIFSIFQYDGDFPTKAFRLITKNETPFDVFLVKTPTFQETKVEMLYPVEVRLPGLDTNQRYVSAMTVYAPTFLLAVVMCHDWLRKYHHHCSLGSANLLGIHDPDINKSYEKWFDEIVTRFSLMLTPCIMRSQMDYYESIRFSDVITSTSIEETRTGSCDDVIPYTFYHNVSYMWGDPMLVTKYYFDLPYGTLEGDLLPIPLERFEATGDLVNENLRRVRREIDRFIKEHMT